MLKAVEMNDFSEFLIFPEDVVDSSDAVVEDFFKCYQEPKVPGTVLSTSEPAEILPALPGVAVPLVATGVGSNSTSHLVTTNRTVLRNESSKSLIEVLDDLFEPLEDESETDHPSDLEDVKPILDRARTRRNHLPPEHYTPDQLPPWLRDLHLEGHTLSESYDLWMEKQKGNTYHWIAEKHKAFAGTGVTANALQKHWSKIEGLRLEWQQFDRPHMHFLMSWWTTKKQSYWETIRQDLYTNEKLPECVKKLSLEEIGDAVSNPAL